VQFWLLHHCSAEHWAVEVGATLCSAAVSAVQGRGWQPCRLEQLETHACLVYVCVRVGVPELVVQAPGWCGSLVVHNGDVDVSVQGRKPAVIAVALHIKALWDE